MNIGFLHFTQAPTEEAKQAFPDDIEPPTSARKSKYVFFHDESTFQSNEDQSLQWGLKGSKIIKPKSKGAGIMVSDFIDEHNGFLAFNDEEHEKVKALNLLKYARKFLKYGESREGYWDRDKFVGQMKTAIQMVEIKNSKTEGWR